MNLSQLIEKGYTQDLTEEEAITIAETGIIETWDASSIVAFQLFQRLLCMDFDAYHSAIQVALDRPVWTHEFAYPECLKEEYLGLRARPTMQEIINLIPEEKRIIIRGTKNDQYKIL